MRVARVTDTDPGSSALRKVLQRLLPFTMLLFFFSLIDRTNISFAALQMNEDLDFGPTVYGFAAGIFFVGYCLFEIPSNLVLMRVGARRWLARIMLTWGVIVVATAWVSGLTSFYVMRFLLGVAEAGLLPGLFYYLGAWIPASHRGLGLSVLMSTAALSNVRVRGSTIAPPRPWTARARISASTVGASAAATEPSVKTVSPSANMRRRPKRSPSAAPVSRKTANVSV